MDDRGVDDGHVRAAVRLALRAHGFTVSAQDVAAARQQWQTTGECLLAGEFQSRLPAFVHGDTLSSTPYLVTHLPRMLGFGHAQAVLFGQLSVGEQAAVAPAAAVAAAFSAGIALLDALVDELDAGEAVYATLTPAVVERIFEDPATLESDLAAACKTFADPHLEALCALVAICAHGFRELAVRGAHAETWEDLRTLVGRLYRAQRAMGPGVDEADARAKSVLPFVVVERIVALGLSHNLASPAFGAAAAIGEVVCLADDLVDVLDDSRAAIPTTVTTSLDLKELTHSQLYVALHAGAEILTKLLDDERLSHPAASRFARIAIGSWVGWRDGKSPMAGARCHSDPAVTAATAVLLREQAGGYTTLAHRLSLPRPVDGIVTIETHSAVIFPRAVVLDSLIDAREAGLAIDERVVAAEVLAIMTTRHPSSRGGWSYIPAVPELPPDADDLAMVLRVLSRVGGADLARACTEPIDLVLASRNAAGGFPTWIFDPEADAESAAAMRCYVELTRAGGVHPDVVATLLESLLLYDAIAYREEILSGVSYLETVQNADGSWNSRWYAGPYYGTYRALSVIAQVAPGSQAIARAVAFTLTTQRDDGGWGEGDDPLATAFALLALVAAGRTESQAHSRGVAWLRAHQESDGSWPERPFIEFPHPGGQSVERYGHRLITTAFSLKALCARQAFTGAVALSTSESARVAPDVSYGGWT